LNKADLVDAVAAAAAVGKREVDQVVGEFIDQITRALQAGEKVNIPGLGALSTAATKPRMGRNPRTGVAVRITAGVRVKFSASSTLKRAVSKKATARRSTGATAKNVATATKAPATKKAATRTPAKKAPAAKATGTRAAAKKTPKKAPAKKR